MKNLLYPFVIFIMIINVQIIFCSDQKIPCGSWCESQVYPYKFCDNSNTIITLCARNPNNNIFGYKAIKMMIPADFIVEPFPDNYYCGVIRENGDVLFDPFDYITKIDQARARWNNLCPPQGPNEEYPWCTIKIRWESNKYAFPKGTNPKTTRAWYTYALYPRAYSPCEINCDKAEIVLNYTDDFLIPDVTNPCDYTGYFFTTGTTDKSDWYSLYAVLLHEMGHYFGFSDQYTGDGMACSNLTSIMNNSGFEYHTKDMNQDDECMFKKLYCCEETASEIIDIKSVNNFVVKIFPNPTNTRKIYISISPAQIGITKWKIVDVNGNVKLTGLLKEEQAAYDIDIESLLSGTYFIILYIKDGIVVEKYNVIN